MLGVLNRLAVPLILRMTSISKFKKSINGAGRKIIRYHSHLVPILMIHKAKREDEKHVGCLTIYRTGPETVGDAHQGRAQKYYICFKNSSQCMYDRPVLVYTKAAGLIEVILHLKMAKT